MKFKLIDNSTGRPLSMDKGQMIVMNKDGQLWMVNNMGNYDTVVIPLSAYCTSYSVLIATEKDQNGKWIYESN